MNQKGVKNYYQILGVPAKASTFQIERAYEKLITKWHPDRNKENQAEATKKFNDINEAFQVLSNRNTRAHYDEIYQKGYSLEDAESTFNNFFRQHDIISEEERRFFEGQKKVEQQKKIKNYYSVLGLPKTASLSDIKNAYRKLAIQYHPKNHPGKTEMVDKFLQINQAYEVLSDQKRKQVHQRVFIEPFNHFRSNSIFQDYFGMKINDFSFDSEFEPTLQKRWSRNLDRLMDDQIDFGYVKNGQTLKESTVYARQNGQQTRKTVKSRYSINNNIPQQVKIEQYVYPNGEKQVVRTVTEKGVTTKTTYQLKKGEQLPKQLTL